MKKILLSLSALALLSTAANADLLVGVEYNVMSSMTEEDENTAGATAEADFSYQPFMLKVGFGEAGKSYTSIYYQSTELEYDDFGSSTEPFTEIGVDFVRQFDIGVKSVNPLLEFGVGYGWMDGNYANADSRAAVSFKVGGGLSYYVVPQVELVAGVNYQYRMWQDIDTSYTTISTSDSGVNVFVGVNVWPFTTGSTTPDAGSYEEVSNDTKDSGAY